MFCRYCGKELVDYASFCSKCGKATNVGTGSYAPPASNPVQPQALVVKFSERVKTNAIIWVIIASIQIILGIFINWVLLIIGVLNIISSITDFNYAKNVLLNPKGIVARVKPLVGPIITLIYNLIFGGLIGVAGSIYYFIGIRGFVLEHENTFQAIDESLNR